jgi:hypothetical protein
MMKILEHRGGWFDHKTKKLIYPSNSLEALSFSLKRLNGIETDVRDQNNHLVISHDLPEEESLLLEDLFSFYRRFKGHTTIALNIKCDGLSFLLSNLIERYQIKSYFTFDMSLPETIKYCQAGLNFFLRYSDLEQSPMKATPFLYSKCSGVVVDQFNYELPLVLKYRFVTKLLDDNKSICIISPELHFKNESNNSQLDVWSQYKKLFCEMIEKGYSLEKVFLCTDYPEEADSYFNS